MAKQGISIREASRRLAEQGVEISEAGIRKWIKKKIVTPFEDGSLDPGNLRAYAALARQDQSPIHGGKRLKGQVGTVTTDQPPADEQSPAGVEPKKGMTFEQARIATEVRRARMQDLEYAEAAKELVSRAKVEKALTDLGALTRAVLERIPDQQAPILAPETDLHTVRMRLLEALNVAMQEIADNAIRLTQEMVQS